MRKINVKYIDNDNDLDTVICNSSYSILITDILLNNILLNNNKYRGGFTDVFYKIIDSYYYASFFTKDFYFSR